MSVAFMMFKVATKKAATHNSVEMPAMHKVVDTEAVGNATGIPFSSTKTKHSATYLRLHIQSISYLKA